MLFELIDFKTQLLFSALWESSIHGITLLPMINTDLLSSCLTERLSVGLLRCPSLLKLQKSRLEMFCGWWRGVMGFKSRDEGSEEGLVGFE